MLKTAFITLTFTFTLIAVIAQKNTYIGVEAAVNNDVYDIIDNGTLLKKVPIITGYAGINIRQDLGPKVFLETGLLRKSYYEGIGFKSSPGYTNDDAIRCWLIPLRLGTRINIHKQKLFFVPVIGYALGINSDYGYGDGGSGGIDMLPKDTTSYTVYSKLSLRRTYPLLQAGLGIEFIFFRAVLMSVTANYYTGFKNLIEQNIMYTHNSVSYTASGLSKGDIMSFGFAAKYPISNLWKRLKR